MSIDIGHCPSTDPAELVCHWIHQIEADCGFRLEVNEDLNVCQDPQNKTAECHYNCCPRKGEVVLP